MNTIETDRLLLRYWQGSDLQPFAAMNADPKVMRYFLKTFDTKKRMDVWENPSRVY